MKKLILILCMCIVYTAHSQVPVELEIHTPDSVYTEYHVLALPDYDTTSVTIIASVAGDLLIDNYMTVNYVVSFKAYMITAADGTQFFLTEEYMMLSDRLTILLIKKN